MHGNLHEYSFIAYYPRQGQWLPSLVPRPFVGETAWQLTWVQTVYGYDVKKITAAPVRAMNIG